MGRVEGCRAGGAWAPSPEGAGALVCFLLRSQEPRLEIGIFFSNYVFVFEQVTEAYVVSAVTQEEYSVKQPTAARATPAFPVHTHSLLKAGCVQVPSPLTLSTRSNTVHVRVLEVIYPCEHVCGHTLTHTHTHTHTHSPYAELAGGTSGGPTRKHANGGKFGQVAEA